LFSGAISFFPLENGLRIYHGPVSRETTALRQSKIARLNAVRLKSVISRITYDIQTIQIATNQRMVILLTEN
jgi:hypothetical protein